MIFEEQPTDFKPWFEVAACLCEFDGTILLLKRLEGKAEGGKWGAPGGKRDVGETIPEAAVRELREETGIQVAESQLKLVRTFFCPRRRKGYCLSSTSSKNRPNVRS